MTTTSELATAQRRRMMSYREDTAGPVECEEEWQVFAHVEEAGADTLLPQRGDTHPVFTLLRVTERQGRYEQNDLSIWTITYQKPGWIPPPKPTEREAGDIEQEVTCSLREASTIHDGDGNLLDIAYPLSVLRPEVLFRFRRWEATIGLFTLMDFVGKVNDRPLYGHIATNWLLESVEARRGGQQYVGSPPTWQSLWEVTFTLHYRSEGWNYVEELNTYKYLYEQVNLNQLVGE